MAFFSRLNPTPAFPELNGPYKVGSIDVEIASSDLQPTDSTFTPAATVAFRMFYPCSQKPEPAAPVYWVQQPQKSIVSAYVRFLGIGNRMADILSYFPQLLYHITLPVHRNASLLEPPTSSRKWPVIIFSHGLGGSRNAYSHLCGSLASYGFVVLAPEHRDGSSIISYVRATKQTKASIVQYQRYPHQPSPEVYHARDEMLRTRVWEVSLVHEALQKLARGKKITNLDSKDDKKDATSPSDVFSNFKDTLDVHTPGSVIFAGHSFGAATTVQFVKSMFYHPANPHFLTARANSWVDESPLLKFTPSSSLLAQVSQATPTILLDMWGLPLKSPNTLALNSLPMPHFTQPFGASPTTSPILAILSSAFVAWTSNFDDVKSALARPVSAADIPAAQLFYPLSSAHLSQSDFGILFPRVTKYLAKAPEPERTMELNVRACLQTLRDLGREVAGKQDPDILSTKEGTVLGWVAVEAGSSEAVSQVYTELDEKTAIGADILHETAVLDGAGSELDGSVQEVTV